MATVLLIEDDPDIGALVTRLLERSGHVARHASDGSSGLRIFFEARPDLVVLDVGLPGIDGWEVLDRIRSMSDVPVMMLTAQSAELDRVRGLRAGADDFVAKPFGIQELIARVDALLRRAAIGARGRDDAPDVYVDAVLTVDHVQRIVVCGDQELRLTPTEFKLLAAFVRNPGTVLSADRIIDLVWGDAYISRDQVKLAVGRLRKRLEHCVARDVIETVRGFGYRYVAAHPPAGLEAVSAAVGVRRPQCDLHDVGQPLGRPRDRFDRGAACRRVARRRGVQELLDVPAQ